MAGTQPRRTGPSTRPTGRSRAAWRAAFSRTTSSTEEDRITEYRRLGKAGLQVSALALGAEFKYGDQMGEGEVRQCMVAAREAGINFFDNGRPTGRWGW